MINSASAKIPTKNIPKIAAISDRDKKKKWEAAAVAAKEVITEIRRLAKAILLNFIGHTVD